MPFELKIDPDDTIVFWEGGQNDFMHDWVHKYIALEGGWSGGKTWAGARKLVAAHIYNAFDINGEPTYINSACVAPTVGNFQDFDLPELMDALEEAGLTGIWKGPPDSSIHIPELSSFKKKSRIICRTADVPERITGWQVGALWGDEAARWKIDWINPKNDPFMQCIGRCRHPLARFIQLMFTYTNEGDGTRIFKTFNDPDKKRTHALYRAPTVNNKLMGEFYRDVSEQLTEEMATQYLEGGAMSLSGNRVYTSFSDVNIDESLEYNKRMPLQLSLDFNIDPGMNGTIGQFDHINNVFTTLHEIHEKRMDVIGLMTEFARMYHQIGGPEFPEIEIFGDPTGANAWAGTGESCYQIVKQTLEEFKIFNYRLLVKSKNPPVVDRINAVNLALRSIKGETNYKIHPRCQVLIRDYRELRRDKKGAIDKGNQELSHMSDAEGYRIEYLRPFGNIKRKATTARVGVHNKNLSTPRR